LREVGERSALIAQLTSEPAIVGLLSPGLSPVRTILFDKTPEENWPVSWHQDLSVAVVERVPVEGYSAWTVKNGVPHVQPPLPVMEGMVTVRLHLDDTPAENGALRVVPRSHLRGRIPSDEIMTAVGAGQVTCECQAGDVLLMKPLLLHASSRSREAGHRRVIHIEYARRQLLSSSLRWHAGSGRCVK
jgi:ectoine hydroxylase-related dioxygenase (phytanoyl-CoA dioxygenase family)